MKFPLAISLLLLSFLSFAQEKTYTKSQLDSIAKQEAFSEKDATSFAIIENVPVYKGCENEKGNIKKKNCMSEKIGELFKKHFKTVVPADSKIKPGKTRIFVQFHIDKKGFVSDSTARSSDEYLEKEALRVLKFIPQCKPGFQKGEPVKVPFSLPLLVNIEHEATEDLTYPVFRGCDKEMSNDELKKCSEKKIKNFIKMSFDLGIADAVMPLEKSTQFQLDFIINKKGKVEHVNAKANHRAIAIEAIKVAKRIPKFKKPGTKNGKPIDTPFSLLMTIYF